MMENVLHGAYWKMNLMSQAPSKARLALPAALFAIAAWGAQDKPVAAPPQTAAPAQEAASAKPAENRPAIYVGSDTCQSCHEDIFKAFQKNPHHLVESDKKYGHTAQACEACHGPGGKHAESMSAADIRQPAKLTAAAADRTCLSCHLHEATHVGRINSSHAKDAVSCVSCHAIHKTAPESLVARTAAGINRQCATCHDDVWASFQRPFRHKLPDNAMSCVDCHNPHGSALPRAMQTVDANEPGCFKCHGDKRGPFTYEHAPVRMEGCTACHEPHGSANPRMLTRAQVGFLCLECHANFPPAAPTSTAVLGTIPPSFHDLRNPRFQNCTICHEKVHGSYVDRNFLK